MTLESAPDLDVICVPGGPGVDAMMEDAALLQHAGLGITEADWQITVKHVVATLDKFKVPQKEKDELLGIVSGLKADIVEKK